MTLILMNSLPPFGTLVLFGAIGFIWSYASLRLASYLKVSKHVRTGYTRKIFHVSIFLSVVLVHLAGGLPAVCAFGVMTSLIVAYAVFRGTGHPLYEAIAREEDQPHRSYYVVVPYFATLIGGIASNALFGPVSLVGYLVAGIGDAAGEPVGTRWGRHRYTISHGRRTEATKSIEGSLAVLTASMIALLIAIPQWTTDFQILLALSLIALSCTVVEALSPRGWDNTPMQVLPSFLVFLLLRS